MRTATTISLLAFAPFAPAFQLEDLLIRTKPPVVRELETTGYCNCERCCSWTWSWHGFGNPVFTSGRLKGRRKEVGVTASGGQARLGTVAADTSELPIGTLLYVQDFGWGRVEDRGGAIRGERLDLWFDDQAKARQWGRRKVPVKIWLPSGTKPAVERRAAEK